MSLAIKIENLSKIYQLGQIGTGTLYNDLKRFSAKIQGKADPFLKIGEENQSNVNASNFVYSLKDINLEINQGDAVGIIGKNGAGKTTLLTNIGSGNIEGLPTHLRMIYVQHDDRSDDLGVPLIEELLKGKDMIDANVAREEAVAALK
eukprot:gene42057-66248_t